MTVDDEASLKILDRLKRRILASYGGISAGILFIAELDQGAVSMSAFIDQGDHIVYDTPSFSWYLDLLEKLKTRLPLSKQWDEIVIHAVWGHWEVIYGYPEDFDVDESSIDRRSRIVLQYLGDKPVVYPAPDHLNWEVDDEMFHAIHADKYD